MNGPPYEPDLIVRREGAAGVIRLNKPKTINALTQDMTRGMASALDDFAADPAVGFILLEGAGERGLCAGGDIRSLYESAIVGGDFGKIFWREEYNLNARIASFAKPYVAFMEGIVMGGGVGVSAHGSHRIVTEKTRLAMPEVGIGFFPDVGGTWLLSRAPGELGTYFGLTTQTMDGADAIAAGFADAMIASSDWPALRNALTRIAAAASGEVITKVIGLFASPVQPAPAAREQKRIDALFGYDAVEEIFAALERDGSDFAQTALKAMREKSPTSLKVALRLLRLARSSNSLRECLVREYGAALEVFTAKDFAEGIRAAIIDKDRNPKWSPARIEDVTPEIVARYFAPRGKDELVFPN